MLRPLLRLTAPWSIRVASFPLIPDRDDVSVDLIHRAKAGERQALEELIETWRTYLLHVTQGSLGQQMQAKLGASDIVQSACLEVHKHFDDFCGESVEEWKSWLRNLLVRDIQDARRRFQESAKRDVNREQSLVDDRGAAVDLPADALTPRSSLIAKEESMALRRALKTLSEEHRQVLKLRNWDELSFAEIGERLGRSSEAARKLWSRAATRLELALNEIIDEA